VYLTNTISCTISGTGHEQEVAQLCTQAKSQAATQCSQVEEQKALAQTEKKRQKTEHRLQHGHLKSLENDLGTDSIRKAFNAGITEARIANKRKHAQVDLTKEDENPMLTTIAPLIAARLVNSMASHDVELDKILPKQSYTQPPPVQLAAHLGAAAARNTATSGSNKHKPPTLMTMGEAQDRLAELHEEKRALRTRINELLQQSSDAEIVKGFRRYLQEAIAHRVIAEHYQFLGDLSANLPQLSSLDASPALNSYSFPSPLSATDPTVIGQPQLDQVQQPTGVENDTEDMVCATTTSCHGEASSGSSQGEEEVSAAQHRW